MNYKDPENILLITCGAMGIAALSLIFRYIFIGLGFDSFGANLVFIITFIIGLIFFVSYLEFIQRVIPPIFQKRKIEQQVEKLDNTIELKVAEVLHEVPIVENNETVPNELDIIRKNHEQKELERKEKLLEMALQYTRTTFVPYATDENINRLCDYVIYYYKGIELRNIQPVTVKDLSSLDLLHFGWNIWNHFRINNQDDIVLFLKAVFARNLEGVEIYTIKKKLTFNEGKFKIELKKSKI